MSLLTKLILIFSAILVLSFGLLNAITAAQIINENDATIDNEQKELMQSCSVLVVSYFIEEGYGKTQAGFASAGEQIAQELTAVFSNAAAAYYADGSPLYVPPEFTYDTTEDIINATNGNSSYTVVQTEQHVSAYLSFPVLAEEEVIGIMRLYSDYTDLYRTGQTRSATMLIETLMALSVGFVLVYIVVRRVVSPVQSLRNAIVEFTKNPRMHENISVKREDEIGELTRAYNNMADTIVAQMDMIEAEKEVLADTIRYRKEFFDNVTHELKTPITIIMGYADMLQDADKESEFFAQGLQNISAESKRLSSMVTELLEESRFSHTARIAPQKFEINRVITEIAETMSLKAKRYDVGIEVDLPQKMATLGNAEQIRRLFVNLIDNAIKYSCAHDSVRVKGRILEEHIVVECSNRMQNPITEEELANIFKPFYRAENSGETGSVGLGLAICREIVEEHAGSIDAKLSEDRREIIVTTVLERCEIA